MGFRSRTALLLPSCCRPSINSDKRRRAAAINNVRYNILFAVLLLQVLIAAAAAGAVAARSGGTKGLQRMRAAKVAHVHGLQAVPESLNNNESLPKDKQSRTIDNGNHLAGKYGKFDLKSQLVITGPKYAEDDIEFLKRIYCLSYIFIVCSVSQI